MGNIESIWGRTQQGSICPSSLSTWRPVKCKPHWNYVNNWVDLRAKMAHPLTLLLIKISLDVCWIRLWRMHKHGRLCVLKRYCCQLYLLYCVAIHFIRYCLPPLPVVFAFSPWSTIIFHFCLSISINIHRKTWSELENICELKRCAQVDFPKKNWKWKSKSGEEEKHNEEKLFSFIWVTNEIYLMALLPFIEQVKFNVFLKFLNKRFTFFFLLQ